MDTDFNLWWSAYLAALASGAHQDDAENIAYASVEKAHSAIDKLEDLYELVE